MNLEQAILLNRHQAEWTRPMRRELYRRARLAFRDKVLDVGCGEGGITKEMAEICRGEVIGVDCDSALIELAEKDPGRAGFEVADARALPYPRASFDLVTCHWLLLWLTRPEAALAEFARVLKPGGALLVACEPDYGGRMVEPAVAEFKNELMKRLSDQGADPLIGRKLPGLLASAGFSAVSGIYPGLWDFRLDHERLRSELEWMKTVLEGVVPELRLDEAATALETARDQGGLVMFTPVFWALGVRA